MSGSGRRITRSATKTSTSPIKLEALPDRPRYADLAVERQRTKSLPTRRRLPMGTADDAAPAKRSSGRNVFQQDERQADAEQPDDGDEEDEAEDESDEDEKEYEQDGMGEEQERQAEEAEESREGTRPRKRSTAATSRKRSPVKPHKPAAPPSSQSLLGQLLPFVWTVWKYSLLATVLALLAAPFVLLLLQPSLMTSPLSSMPGHSVLSALRSTLTSLSGLFSSSPSSTAIARSVHSNLSSTVEQLSRAHPQYAASLRATIEPLLDDHFDLRSRHSNRPLVLFVAHSPATPVSAVQSFASDLSSLLYPPAVPSYYLDLTAIAAQKHFDGAHLDAELRRHFEAHDDGLVLLPALTSLQHGRSVGETLQHWLDDDRAPAKRAVFVLAAAVDTQGAKRTDEADKMGASREKSMARDRLKLAMRREKGDGKGEDELIEAILSRVVRNVVVLK